jgi:uncharacterized membrane protein YeaQ/YmgE (transglycosylase-associated protein family)
MTFALVEETPMTLTLTELLILLVVAGICGALGKAITGFARGGILVSIALGFIGALIGVAIQRALNLPLWFTLQIGDAPPFPIIWAVLGAALFMAVIGLFTRGWGPRRYWW